MKNINIELTETEYKSVEYTALSVEDLINNFAHEQARRAIDSIVQITMNYCLDNGLQLPTTKEEIVAYAFDNNIVKTAAQRNEEAQQEV